jgi:hypothetical protein
MKRQTIQEKIHIEEKCLEKYKKKYRKTWKMTKKKTIKERFQKRIRQFNQYLLMRIIVK